MKIFISWSGNRSRYIAEQLRDWLPKVLQFTKPWCSSRDIEAGDFWDKEIREELKDCQFAIICLTKENIRSPWINYEAGAISEKLGGRVCPYLFEISPSDLSTSPLNRLQAVEADEKGTFKLVDGMNSVAKKIGIECLEREHLRETFDIWWNRLEEGWESIRGAVEQMDNKVQNDLRKLASVNSVKDILIAIKKVIEDISETVTGDEQIKLKKNVSLLITRLDMLNDIACDISIWNEAGIWLKNNQKRLVSTVVDSCLKEHSELLNLGRSLDSPKKRDEFQKNIDNYISWVLLLIEKQSDRITLNERPVIPDKQIYIAIFNSIIESVVNCDSPSPSRSAKSVIEDRVRNLIEKFNG
jgi:TIR domain